MCGATAITKAIMAPRVHTSKGAGSLAEAQKAMAEAQKLAEMAHRVRKHVESTHDYVGPQFAAEARDMHEGLTPERPIYGEATRERGQGAGRGRRAVAALPVFSPPNDDGGGAEGPAAETAEGPAGQQAHQLTKKPPEIGGFAVSGVLGGADDPRPCASGGSASALTGSSASATGSGAAASGAGVRMKAGRRSGVLAGRASRAPPARSAISGWGAGRAAKGSVEAMKASRPAG
ncbi:MAG: DUF1178 family protein [Asticcacaulis sp.]